MSGLDAHGGCIGGQWCAELEVREYLENRAAKVEEPKNASFEGWVCDDPTATPFQPERQRYILYVAAACPFAARPWSVATLLGLDESDGENPPALEIVKLFPGNLSQGWFFAPGTTDEEIALCKAHPDLAAECSPEPVHGFKHMHEMYIHSNPEFNGRVTVPVLFDKKTDTIVNNQSLTIARILATQFPKEFRTRNVDLFPPGQVDAIKELAMDLNKNVNAAVYPIHFSADQHEFSSKCLAYFARLDELNDLLGKQDYLMGDQLTFVDLQLFATLIRQDIVYAPLFGAACKSVRFEMPALWSFVQRVYAYPGIAKCVNLMGIKTNYYHSKALRQRGGLTVPLGPESLPSALAKQA